MSSPVSVDHGDMDGDVGTWLGVYKVRTPGTASGRNTTSFLLHDTPQPDLNLRMIPECGGASWVEDKYLHGIPELLAEICRSSASYDLHVKLDLYEAARVPEYLAVLLMNRKFAGTHSWTANTSCSRPTRTACGGPGSFPACGSMARPSLPAT
jgi:hypothetical protein